MKKGAFLILHLFNSIYFRRRTNEIIFTKDRTFFDVTGRCFTAMTLGIGCGLFIRMGGESPVAACLITAGSSLIDFMPILFAVGVALGMSKDQNGASALSGLVGYLVVTNLLSPDSVAMLQQIDVEAVDAAFGNIENQFIGILVGAIAAAIYNRFS